MPYLRRRISSLTPQYLVPEALHRSRGTQLVRAGGESSLMDLDTLLPRLAPPTDLQELQAQFHIRPIAFPVHRRLLRQPVLQHFSPHQPPRLD